jgi:hypothetical protein
MCLEGTYKGQMCGKVLICPDWYTYQQFFGLNSIERFSYRAIT